MIIRNERNSTKSSKWTRPLSLFPARVRSRKQTVINANKSYNVQIPEIHFGKTLKKGEIVGIGAEAKHFGQGQGIIGAKDLRQWNCP